jgi:hypothetical protein
MADDRAQARREAAALLAVDIEHLSPADNLRVDMVSALRLVIDSEQASILSGNSADVARLNVAVASLIALLPNSKLPEPKPVDGGPTDPRTIMWENYKRMRDRGALHGEGYDGKVAENERLKARVAELEAALAVSGGTFVPPVGGENSPPAPVGGANAPAGDNVVTFGASKNVPAPAAPAADLVDLRASRANGAGGSAGFRVGPADEPWRRY